MREIMDDNRVFDASRVSSFGLESLVWNLKDSCFTEYPTVLWYVFNKVVSDIHSNAFALNTYFEVNGIKKLCPDDRSVAAYSDFANSLKNFYEYEAD